MHSRSIHARLRPALTASLLLLLVLAVVGCGSLGGLPGRVEQPQIVTEQDINRYPADSPVRAVLEWWRALQFKSAPLATRYYAPEADVTVKQIESALKIGPGLLNLTDGIRVVEVNREGREATVLVMLTKKLRHPNGRTDIVRTPVSFDLVEQDGRWLLTDNQYMARILRNVSEYVEKGSGKQPKE
jgi:hypothetical protein